jgi:hypothetical protein
MRTHRQLITLTLVLTLAACGGDPADEFRDAVPTRDQLAMNVPQSAQSQTQSGEIGSTTAALLGQKASLYLLTYKVSHEVNGSIWVGLNIIESIVQHPPTSIENGVATWGPHTPPLEPLTWMLKVTKKGPGDFLYALSARQKGDTAGEFKVILAGASAKGYSPVFSGYKGVYTANATNLNSLDPMLHPDTGEMVATYDTTGLKRSVKMALNDYSENGAPPADALYSYLDRVDTSGEFGFISRTDLQKNGSAEEVFAVGVAWDQTGAGRGDAAVTGGDLSFGDTVKLTECWDSSFGRVFYMDSHNINPAEGDAAACVFSAPLQ